MLEKGTKAPSFTLPDKDGNMVSLEDFKGKKTVVYFYPKDNTPGCTKQACAFAANFEKFKALDVAVIGISKDSAASHLKFAQKYDLPFIILSDTELTDQSLRCMAGEKTVRQGEHGCCAHNIYN